MPHFYLVRFARMGHSQRHITALPAPLIAGYVVAPSERENARQRAWRQDAAPLSGEGDALGYAELAA